MESAQSIYRSLSIGRLTSPFFSIRFHKSVDNCQHTHERTTRCAQREKYIQCTSMYSDDRTSNEKLCLHTHTHTYTFYVHLFSYVFIFIQSQSHEALSLRPGRPSLHAHAVSSRRAPPSMPDACAPFPPRICAEDERPRATPQ